MWAEILQNIQVRRQDGNDLEFLNLNMITHLAQYTTIVLSEPFEFSLITDDDEPENFEECEVIINYKGNNNVDVFDMNRFMHWFQMTLYPELVREQNTFIHNNEDGCNDEKIELLTEFINLFSEFKDVESFENIYDAIAMNLFYENA